MQRPQRAASQSRGRLPRGRSARDSSLSSCGGGRRLRVGAGDGCEDDTPAEAASANASSARRPGADSWCRRVRGTRVRDVWRLRVSRSASVRCGARNATGAPLATQREPPPAVLKPRGSGRFETVRDRGSGGFDAVYCVMRGDVIWSSVCERTWMLWMCRRCGKYRSFVREFLRGDLQRSPMKIK